MSKASDAGRAFLTGVLAKVPETLRAQVETALLDPTSEEALVVIGAGVLGQSEINRRFDELKTKEDALTEDYNKLNAWYGDRKADLDELVALKAKGTTGTGVTPEVRDPNATAAPDLSKYLTEERFAAALRTEQMAAANYLGLQNVLTLSHYKDFGEILDTRDLLADKRLGSQLPDGRIFGLKDAYDAKFADRLTARDKAADEARVKKLADEMVAERMKGLPSQVFPLRNAPSPLDLLDPNATTKPTDAAYSVDAAVAEYNRLQESRQSA